MEENNISSDLLPETVGETAPASLKELFQQGLTFYSRGDLDKASEVFSNILSSNPDHIEAQINLGNVYFSQDRIDDALSCWKKVLSADSARVVCYINIGNAYYALGNIPEAISHWNVAATMAPDHPKALMNLGAAYDQLNDKINSFRFYEQFLKSCSNSATSRDYKRVHNNVAYLKQIALQNIKVGFKYQKRGDLRKAAMCYLKSINTYPNFPKAHLNMGSICYMAEKYDHAIKYWLQALMLDPEHENTYCNLGIAYDRVNQYDNAYCLYKRYLKAVSKKDSETDNIETRLEQIKKYLDKHPEIVKKHLDLAENLYRKRKYDQSLWEYENYVILAPEQAGAYEAKVIELKDYLDPVKKASRMSYEIGNTLFKQQKFDKALQAYKRYIHLAPKGEFAEDAYKKISECGKLISKVLKAALAAD